MITHTKNISYIVTVTTIHSTTINILLTKRPDYFIPRSQVTSASSSTSRDCGRGVHQGTSLLSLQPFTTVEKVARSQLVVGSPQSPGVVPPHSSQSSRRLHRHGPSTASGSPGPLAGSSLLQSRVVRNQESGIKESLLIVSQSPRSLHLHSLHLESVCGQVRHRVLGPSTRTEQTDAQLHHEELPSPPSLGVLCSKSVENQQ